MSEISKLYVLQDESTEIPVTAQTVGALDVNTAFISNAEINTSTNSLELTKSDGTKIEFQRGPVIFQLQQLPLLVESKQQIAQL